MPTITTLAGSTYKLTSRRMIETDRFWGRYSAKRRDIRLMFLHLLLHNSILTPYEVHVNVRYRIGRKSHRTSASILNTRLGIGCQVFSSSETQKLMSWAFEEPTH